MSLRHRLRRDPFEQNSGGSRVGEMVEELFADEGVRGDGRGAGGHGQGLARGHGHQPRPPEREAAQGATGPRGERGGRGRSEEKVLPEVEARPPADAAGAHADGKGRAETFGARRRSGARRSTFAPRGRHAGATEKVDEGARRLALGATLRAAAARRSPRAETPSTRALDIELSDVRYKRFRAREGTLYVFAVDASGSMALNRIGAARGALAHLLRRSYVNRDRVALVTFRGERAETLLRPSAAPALARRLLDALPVGGATPLADGLRHALEVARRAQTLGASRVRLVLFTDGRANVAAGTRDAADHRRQVDEELTRLGASLRAAGIVSTVVDTANRFTSAGEARALAAKLGGDYVRLAAGGPDAAESFRQRWTG